jgi:two-component system LytT family sensor kinase
METLSDGREHAILWPTATPLGNRRSGNPQQDSIQHPQEWNNHHVAPHWNNDFPQGNMPPEFHGGPINWRIDSTSLFIFLMIMAISTAIKTVQQWQLTEQRAARAEADKASAELSFLKAQINPHFLFNTLNNIYTLAVTKDEYAPDSIMKLSNIMRYVTDDVSVDLVPLQSEIDCITDYIELQRLRMNDDTHIDFTVKGGADNKTIPPLVLMTFIENVFKYGISNHEPSVITINIVVNDSITLFCQNRIFNTKKQTQRTGIGIKNTKQRLEHLYPGRHLLYITSDNEYYTVQLTLQS